MKEGGSIVQEAVVPLLTTWQNFYVIIGSAAAALTGLMFVVITLIVGANMQGAGGAFGAFGSPTVVHFCFALFIAAALNAPWQALWNASIPLGLAGLAGEIYFAIVLRRMFRQNDYKPVMEDWLFHAIFPCISYTALVIAAILLQGYPTLALFVIGAVTLLLIFIGIHNSWDTVTYIAITKAQPGDKSQN